MYWCVERTGYVNMCWDILRAWKREGKDQTVEGMARGNRPGGVDTEAFATYTARERLKVNAGDRHSAGNLCSSLRAM